MAGPNVFATASFLVILLAVFQPSAAVPPPPEILRVALYPYVPGAHDLFFKLEAAFEASHPGVNVELVESYRDPQSGELTSLSESYYDGGLLKVEADIYEIDNVLLYEMKEAGKIVPIGLPRKDFFPEARAAVQIDGATWAVPHWICGNFLFYEKGDSEIEQAGTWQELTKAFEKSAGLLLDFKGTSTLGEWYLIGLAGMDGNAAAVLKKLEGGPLEGQAVNALHALLQRCPAGYCRSRDLHERVGYYARVFARGKARAYIGYSESLYNALQEIAANCTAADGCRTPDQIAVRALPTVTPQGKQVGWTDGLAIAANLTEKKKALAIEFIEFATSWKAYQLVLNPDGYSPPKYLLPALVPLTPKPELDPSLYPAFYKAFGSRIIPTAKGLNKSLRDRGGQLDCALPPERDDVKWVTKCLPTRP